MATYVNNLRLKEITTGDEDGTWGTSTNTNLELITDGFSYGTKEIAADANETFTMPDATADATRSLYLKFTSAVDLTATREITLGPNTVSKTWIIENATTGGQIITIKQGSGATVNVPNGSKVMIVTDGAGAGAAVFNANPTEVGGTVTSVGGTGTVNGLTLTGTVTTSGNLTLGGTLANVDLTSQVTGTLPVANGGTGVTSSTGTGSVVLSSSPTLTTPNLGTPSAATLTNATGLPLSTGVTGQLPLANGGTGASLVDPDADRIFFWDDSAGSTAFLTVGSGLQISGTTLSSIDAGGTVTSIDVSGGTTGLTTSGGPITSSGTITLAGTLAVANGGTGATTLTANNVILGNGTSAVQAVAPGTSGNVLTSDGTTWTSAAPAALIGETDSATPFLTALGSGAAAGNTSTALDNTVVGFSSLCTNSLGDRNTVFGACNLQVATGNENIAIGVCNANSLTTAECTIAIGVCALANNTTGTQNIAIGRCAMFCNTVGNNAIAIGHRALYNSCIPFQFNNNVAVGLEALCFVSYGCNNVGLGTHAGGNVSGGTYNIALGSYAMSGSGSCLGSCNIGIGYQAGSSCAFGNLTGSNNIVIGLNAGYFMNNSSCPYRGYVDVGTPTVLCNHIIMGNIAHTCAMVPVGWTTVSDCRDKTCFKEIPHGIDFVRALKPTEYQFRKTRDSEETDGVKRYGFLAQDIIALEGDSPVVASATDPDTLKYTESHMVPILVNAIKDLADEIEKIKDLINKM